MDADWTTSPSGRRVLQHADDARPAWLWSHDGQELLWQNAASTLFLARIKKSGLKRAPLATPLRGQVARNIRLGSSGRTSLARIQFTAGDKPASATCATTPLPWQDGQMALLVVGVDAIGEDVRAAADEPATAAPTETAAAAEVPAAEAPAPPESPSEPATPADADTPTMADWADAPESAQSEVLAFGADADPETAAPADASVATPQFGDDLDAWQHGDEDASDPTVLAVVEDDAGPHEAPQAEAAPADGVAQDQPEVDVGAEPEAAAGAGNRLSRLFDRLSNDEALFTPLTESDDALLAPTAPALPELVTSAEMDAPTTLYRVTGRGLVPDQAEQQADSVTPPAQAEPAALMDTPTEAEMEIEAAASAETMADAQVRRMEEALRELAPPAPDAEAVERASRYNFDELARILNDRIAEPARPSVVRDAPQPSGALVSLGGETLVLNRLPLGILVFRDQQVLFANRAITEMVGYDSVEKLRAAGLAAVFPAAGPEGQEAGPVNHLVQRDGTLVPVTARLQSISWQGRPALMLSASTTEVRTGHEAAVRAFAQGFADLRGDGFLETNRAGTISSITPRASTLLGQDNAMLEGKALSLLVHASDVAGLREFLERPARFADTARPCHTMRSSDGRAEISLFAQGQAGVITGYFGLVRTREASPLRLAGPTEADPALLARISRGVRRPLNTIIGFSDLIRSEAFGALNNERYEEYAKDIAIAGQEIAALVDELDDYARLRDGRYLAQRASIDLTGLLESCVLRIRQQANGARVIVRNAISESLPRVTADRASLAQAVLNLLASAIDQTPTGGAVVISAQREDNGGISVHVRDSSVNPVDMAERFVVFRDGVNRDGQAVGPVRSSVGLALTRSLLAVNAVSLSVDPAGEQGLLFTLVIPADLVDQAPTPPPTE